MVDASPRGIALGMREAKLTCAWRKEPGLYSSNQSTSLKNKMFKTIVQAYNKHQDNA